MQIILEHMTWWYTDGGAEPNIWGGEYFFLMFTFFNNEGWAIKYSGLYTKGKKHCFQYDLALWGYKPNLFDI